MNNNSFYTHLLQLNLAIFFISTSGVLGKYIDLPVPQIILIRSSLAGILLFAFIKVKKIKLKLIPKDRNRIIVGGLLLGAHWLLYFFSLKLSNVATAMISLYTFPIITSMLEPILTNTRFYSVHFTLGLVVLAGVYILIPEFDLNNTYFLGVCLGILSAICYAIRNILLKSQVQQYDQSALMFYQLIIISLVLSPLSLVYDVGPVLHYTLPLIGLALITTAIGHTLFVHSLKHFNVTSASLISSLQPIFGIVLAMVFIKEYPDINTLVGGIIIIGTVVFEAIRLKKQVNEKV